MTYTSQPLPLEFWTRLEVRLASDYQAQRARLTEALVPVTATVDTGAIALTQSADARQSIFNKLRELENIQLLSMILNGQVYTATYRAEIPYRKADISLLRNFVELISSTLIGLPPRQPREQELHTLLNDYNALRNLGTGEITMQERQRLRSMTVELPVVGMEDAVEHERSLRVIQSNIDRKESELQNLMVTTLMSLRIPDELATLVSSFGVQVFPENVTPAVEDTAPAQSSAAGEGA